MELRYENGLFLAVAQYEERTIPSAAGFRWHPGNCKKKDCKVCARGFDNMALWWTTNIEKAEILKVYADDNAMEYFEHLADMYQQSHAVEPRKKIDRENGPADRCADGPADRCADGPADGWSLLAPKGLEYLDYQKAGIEAILSRKHTLLADEMGLGKTIIVLGAINALHLAPGSVANEPGGQANRVVVVCPASLKTVWEDEANKWLIPDFKIGVVNKPDAFDLDDGKKQPWMLILNYERLLSPGVWETLNGQNIDLLVLDEAHYVKNPDAQRTRCILGGKKTKRFPKVVRGLFEQSHRVVALTGTPIKNRTKELQPLAGAMAPETFGNFFQFAHRFCDAKKEKIWTKEWDEEIRQKVAKQNTVWSFDGHSNLDQLQRELRQTIMIRRLKKDVLKDLPPKRRQLIRLPVPNAEVSDLIKQELGECQRLHDPAKSFEENVTTLQENIIGGASKLAKIRHQLGMLKVPQVAEHVKMLLENDEKILLFAHHRAVVEELFKTLGKQSTFVYGGMPMAERKKRMEAFQENDKTRVFIGSIKATGEGLTLTAAGIVLFAEGSWVPGDLTQAEDRVHRKGLKETLKTAFLLIQHLVYDNSADAKVLKVAMKKQAVAEQALDTPREEP